MNAINSVSMGKGIKKLAMEDVRQTLRHAIGDASVIPPQDRLSKSEDRKDAVAATSNRLALCVKKNLMTVL